MAKVATVTLDDVMSQSNGIETDGRTSFDLLFYFIPSLDFAAWSDQMMADGFSENASLSFVYGSLDLRPAVTESGGTWTGVIDWTFDVDRIYTKSGEAVITFEPFHLSGSQPYEGSVDPSANPSDYFVPPDVTSIAQAVAGYNYLISGGASDDSIALTAPIGQTSSNTAAPGLSLGDATLALSDGTAAAVVDSGAGADGINGAAGRMFVFAGSGNDSVTARSGNVVHGGDGNDLITYTAPSGVAIDFSVSQQANGTQTLIGDIYADGFEILWITGSGADDRLDLRSAVLAAKQQSRFDLQGGTNTLLIDGATTGSNVRLTLSGSSDNLSADFTGVTGNVTVTSSSLATPNFSPTIIGGFEQMTVTGGAGHDAISGSSGTDTLDGGAGNDTLTGGAGADIFVWQVTGGDDIITDFNIAAGDRIEFGNLANFTVFHNDDAYLAAILAASTQSGPDLKIDLGAGGSLTLKNVRLEDLTATQFIFPAPLDDVVVGEDGDTLHGGAGTDLLIYDGSTSGSAIDFAVKQAQGDTPTKIGGLYADGFEVFDIKTSDVDAFIDLRGATLVTRVADLNSALTTSRFALGEGHNTVTADFYTQGTVQIDASGVNDELIFDMYASGPGITASATGLSGNGFTLATIGGTSFEKMTVSGGNGDDVITGSAGDDTLDGAAGNDVLGGGAGNDVLAGGAGSDVLAGGAGSDTLTGGGGADTFVFNTSDGADTITDFSIAAGDRIDLTGTPSIYRFSDLLPSLSQSGADTRIDLGGGDSLLLKGVTASSLTAAQFLVRYTTGGAGNDVVVAAAGDTVSGGGGTDLLIYDASSTSSALTFDIASYYGKTGTFGGITLSEFEVYNITFSSANDLILLLNGALPTRAADANSSLTTSLFSMGGGSNIVALRLSDDSSKGVSGAAAFHVTGEDTLNVSTDSLTTSVTISRFGVQSQNFTLTTDSAFFIVAATGGSADDILSGGGGRDFLIGGGGNDVLTGGAFYDTLTGGTGADTFVFNASDGIDTLTDFSIADGDRIDLGGITSLKSFSDLSGKIAQSGGDTVITLSEGNSMTLTGVTASTLTAAQFLFCFYPGTRITTARGQVAVEDLRIGEIVPCQDGLARPIRWIGRQTVTTRCIHPERVLPIRIAAGALAETVPSRDLLVSPDHAVFIDGNLVAAQALINGRTVLREGNVPERFTYFHVEFDDHAVLFAEDAPAESFIDNVDRQHFDNWDEHPRRDADRPPMAELPYPRAKSRRQVPLRTWQQLDARAVACAQTGTQTGAQTGAQTGTQTAEAA